MKKKYFCIVLTIMCTFMLTACGKETPTLASIDYDLTDSNETSKGIAVGDTLEDFLNVYGEYDMLTSIDHGEYQSLPIEEIPFDKSVQTIFASFIVDGNPISITDFCEENEIDRSALMQLFTSEEYLKEHTVLYKYLVFTWENGVISNVESSFMDYNADGSYYQPAN